MERQIYRTIKLYSLPPLLSYFYKSHKYPLNRYNNPFAIPLSSFVFGKGMRNHFLDKVAYFILIFSLLLSLP